jgi:hypothetical protein
MSNEFIYKQTTVSLNWHYLTGFEDTGSYLLKIYTLFFMLPILFASSK